MEVVRAVFQVVLTNLEKIISPTKIGGYDRVEPQNLNSKMVNKTPNNPEIQQNVVPINNNPSTGNGVTHPHQIQVTAQEEPQAVTGASTDTDPTLTLKSAAPKAIEVDVAQENADSEEEERNNNNNTAMIPSTSLSETFARHRKLMLEKLGLCSCGHKPSECDCKPDCKCNCNKKVEECATCGCGDPTDMHDHDKDPAAGMPQDNVGHGSLPEEQQRLDESYAAPFQRMRSLAGVGNMILTSNGIFENKNDPGASEPFNTHWKMDKEKAGYVKIDENKLKKVHATLEQNPSVEVFLIKKWNWSNVLMLYCRNAVVLHTNMYGSSRKRKDTNQCRV